MTFIKTTEQDSHYNHLEKMSIKDVLNAINQEDQNVPNAVAKALPQIERQQCFGWGTVWECLLQGV